LTDVNPIAARAFGTQAAAYERGRPSWPVDAIAALLERFGAGTVLDLAAGTGKLTRILAEQADTVVAVEPVDGMREVLRQQLPHVRTLSGTAESIPLPDGCVDAVFVAEAFHWFDPPVAAAEIARVLKPGGGLAVLWNTPGWKDLPWFDELRDTVTEHHIGPPGYMRDIVPWREALEAEPRFGPLHDEEATHDHVTDRERLLAEIASISRVGSLPPDRLAAALAAARDVLERHGIDRVTMTYRTLITWTQVKRSGSNGSSSTSGGSPQ
jgi:ubiquinone/menaquinone biosynthesis C-methylase UbiE